MKIYLLVHMRSVNETWPETIRGVFSSLELAQEAYPGQWEERKKDYWEREGASLSRAFILEYEVDQATVEVK